MHPNTILKRNDCDVKQLPLGAIEVFVLSQIDGTLTIEEVANIVGLEVSVATKLARKLSDLGVVSATQAPPSSGEGNAVRSSLPPRRKTTSSKLVAQDDCDLDEATRAEISAFEGKLASADHYALLGIERTADKKAIKRAYAALAGKFHPDRFFKKKLGKFRVALERVFQSLTNAQDLLLDRERREAYDASLPPMSEPSPRTKRSPTPLPEKPRAPSVAPAPPVTEPEPAAPQPTWTVSRVPPNRPLIRAADVSSQPRPILPRPPLSSPLPPPAPSQPSDDPLRRLFAKGKQDEKQRRIDVFMRAADDALKRNDVVTAANNYRLVLQNGENPAARKQLESIEEAAKVKQHGSSLARAQAAEREGRWDEAATGYTRAHALVPSVAHAERAAHAICKSGGDLHEAARLAEYAVAAQPSNIAYQATLGEIYLAAKLWTRASRVAERVLQLAPNDARGKAIAAATKAERG